MNNTSHRINTSGFYHESSGSWKPFSSILAATVLREGPSQGRWLLHSIWHRQDQDFTPRRCAPCLNRTNLQVATALPAIFLQAKQSSLARPGWNPVWDSKVGGGSRGLLGWWAGSFPKISKAVKKKKKKSKESTPHTLALVVHRTCFHSHRKLTVSITEINFRALSTEDIHISIRATRLQLSIKALVPA